MGCNGERGARCGVHDRLNTSTSSPLGQGAADVIRSLLGTANAGTAAIAARTPPAKASRSQCSRPVVDGPVWDAFWRFMVDYLYYGVKTYVINR